MLTSPTIGQLIAALAVAQSKYRPVTKDRNASIQSKTGGSFRYAYADLADGIAAIKEALSANGLAVVQPVRSGDGAIVVTTVLAHASGEWISEEMSWPVASNDNRSIGSGITYARRHSLLAMVGTAATDEDDDGEQGRGGDHSTTPASTPMRAAKPPPKPAPTQAPTAPPPPAAAPAAGIYGALWERTLGHYHKLAAPKMAWAVKLAGIPSETPTDAWTEAQAKEVERLLFPMP